MIKQLISTLPIIFIATLIGCSKCNDDSTSWGICNLKGKVLSFRELTYKAEEKFGEIRKGGRFKVNDIEHAEEYVIFNEEGNYSVVYFYYSDSTDSYKYEFVYDKKNNRSERNQLSLKGRLQAKIKYLYDDSGHRIEENIFDSEGILQIKLISKYNGDKKIEEKGYYDSGELFGSQVYKYNKSGLVSEEIIYDANGNITSKYSYIYDDNGNISEEIYYNPDGSLDYKKTYKYELDNKDNWIKCITFIDGKPLSVKERTIEYF